MNDILVEKVGDCELRVFKEGKLLTWIMYSPKTGVHSLTSFYDGISIKRPSKRVRLHWDGFIQNQQNR